MTDNFRKSTLREEGAKFDPFTHSVTVITEEHRLTHDGMVFHTSGRTAALANGANFDLLLVVPAGTYPHLRKTIYHTEGGPVDIKSYEGVTTSADGTPTATHNRNRNSSRVSGTVMTVGPTVTDLGLLIHDLYAPAGGKEVGSDIAGLGEEWNLKPATKYLLRLTNNTGAVMDLSYEFMWYEVGYDHND